MVFIIQPGEGGDELRTDLLRVFETRVVQPGCRCVRKDRLKRRPRRAVAAAVMNLVPTVLFLRSVSLIAPYHR